MSQRPSPPQAPKYLEHRRPSSQKGGTLIIEDVTDLATHQKRLGNRDSYRPKCCPRCGHGVLHVHDYRRRVLRADGEAAAIQVVRHRCTAAECGARWLILPMLLARHLWRRWAVVEASTVGHRPHDWEPIPARTQRRWRARLRSSARMLVQALASSGDAAWEAVAGGLGLAATRQDVVRALGLPLAKLAALLHRLVPGLRLM